MAQVETLKRPAGQEYALLEFLERLDRNREGRIAVHIHLSRLQPNNRREQYIRLAYSTFDNFLAQQNGQSFLLRNNDLVFIGHAQGASAIEDAVIRLRYLFSDDALVQLSERHASDKSGFCSWYVLDRDYDAMLDLCRRLRQMTQTNLPADISVAEPRKTPLDAKNLAKLQDVLSGADLSNLIRNQPICTIDQTNEPQPVFHEVYVSIADLQQAVMPDIDLAADPWLFQYLTLSLDKRMLAHLSREWTQERNFSINLNIATLLSPEFLKFDQMISSMARGRLLIELQKVDIFADMGAFLFAREYVRDRGYRICLDGMTHLTLPFIDREKLGLDMIKLFWSPELAMAENAKILDKLRAAVIQAPQRVILARCDSEESIAIGRSLGISLFQGRHLAKLMPVRLNPLRALRG